MSCILISINNKYGSYGRKQRWLNLKYFKRICLEGFRNNTVRTACAWAQIEPGVSQSQVIRISACPNCSMTLCIDAEIIQQRSGPECENGSSMLLEVKHL
jgi:hypothetical protein